jgi:AraC-like DNA-binding protein
VSGSGRRSSNSTGDQSSLAGVAASLGFADQAHLTRTVRDHVGQTPAALRRAFAVQRNG